eukprot:TRINITY_DN7145_c0_g1_i4.p1 TRINITY_DN7145_c0_g1~~TRINITY_DN7145_c0_g1_i4.p1  ORF type:complete len:559 (+),score=102.26 TRINITY_DN7145_c0_g1_i4:34-1677(+)
MPKKTGSAAGLLARLREATDLQTILEALQEPQGLPREALTSALSTLSAKTATSGGTEEALRIAERMLALAAAGNGGKPPETCVTSVVRICCVVGGVQRALELVAQATAAGMKPKLRTWSPILSQAAAARDSRTCDRIWQEFSQVGLEPQDQEFAAMLRSLQGLPDRQLSVLERLLEELPAPSDPPLLEEIGRVFGVEGAVGVREADPPYASGREECGQRWRVGWSSVSADGRCTLTGRTLRALDVSDEDVAALADCSALLAESAGCKRSFRSFRKWLQEQAPYDVIIDGANVGFSNQNHEGGFFQYNQIDAVVRHLRQTGRRTLLVLHTRWLRLDAVLTISKKKRRRLDQISTKDSPTRHNVEYTEDPQDDDASGYSYPHDPVTEDELEALPGTPLHYIRTWKEWGILLRTPVQECDDWYWLYAALDSAQRGMKHVQVVSNDYMRDHHWRMLRQRTFTQWQRRHMTRVCFSTEADGDGSPEEACAAVLAPPPPFSLRAQVAPDGLSWHFPVPAIASIGEQRSSGRQVAHKELEAADHHWLVAWRGSV